MALLAAILLSFGPALVFAWLLYWLDRYEPEPLPLIIAVFIWGAVVSAGGAFILNNIAQDLFFEIYATSNEAIFAQKTIAAPLIEESLKIFAVLIVFLIRTEEFDSIIDGIVYAGIVALGFAATENVYYLYQGGYLANGVDGLFLQFIFRVLLGAWNHTLYTAIFGIGLALARLNYKKEIRFLSIAIGAILAFFAHAIHNRLHINAEDLGKLFQVMLVDWLAWLLLAYLIFWALKKERQWVFSEMQTEVARGTISNSQYLDLISPKRNMIDYFQSVLRREVMKVER